jgi:hypothetical protein
MSAPILPADRYPFVQTLADYRKQKRAERAAVSQVKAERPHPKATTRRLEEEIRQAEHEAAHLADLYHASLMRSVREQAE